MNEIGAFEAKNQFSKLLDRARNGEAITITRRGVAIARLIPVDRGREVSGAREILERLRRRARQHRGGPISTEEILEWKSAGRR